MLDQESNLNPKCYSSFDGAVIHDFHYEGLNRMTSIPVAPFSARVRGTHHQIDSDFPASARVGLLHLLAELVEKGYIDNWIPFARES